MDKNDYLWIGFIIGAMMYGWVLPWIGNKLSDYYGRKDKTVAWNIGSAVKAPAADVVPVVYCKDCAYRKNAKVNGKGFLICPASGMEITEYDYCSYGERKRGTV